MKLDETMSEPGAEQAMYRLVPEGLREGLVRWVEHAIKPGDFLTAVLTNDLRQAVGRASNMSFLSLQGIVTFLYTYAPSPCWGSPEKVQAWMLRPRREVAA